MQGQPVGRSEGRLKHEDSGAGSPDRPGRGGGRRLLAYRRIQIVSTVVISALLPWLLRGPMLAGSLIEAASLNALTANVVAVIAAFWMRLSVETHPGIRRAYLILVSTTFAHAAALLWFLFTRFPYDRVALGLGFILHVLWSFAVLASVESGFRRRIAVVPFGRIDRLNEIAQVDWLRLKRPSLHDARSCQAIVADFSAELPHQWESFLAEAALAGRIVYQLKELAEALTGRVELEHLSENSFGTLVPAHGYFHLKSLADFLSAALLLPVALPLMLVVAVAVRLDDGGPALFRQKRMGHAGKLVTVYKFRTMRHVTAEDLRAAAITIEDDQRITRLGKFLRRSRLDEVPQIINILKGEMSWIGPRPEAEILSRWYHAEIPFYRYRHVVKPGISGWAQVNQGHVAEVEQVHRKLQYDFYYIKYFSPWLDLLILVRTMKTMMTGFGSR